MIGLPSVHWKVSIMAIEGPAPPSAVVDAGDKGDIDTGMGVRGPPGG